MLPSEITEHISRLAAFVDEAERAIFAGQLIDISEMQYDLQALCKKLETLPPIEAKEALAGVEKLLSAIERLEKDLNMQHDALTEQLAPRTKGANPLFAQEVGNDKNDDEGQ